MTIGGFNGACPAPPLAEFEAMAAGHEIRCYTGRRLDSGSLSCVLPGQPVIRCGVIKCQVRPEFVVV